MRFHAATALVVVVLAACMLTPTCLGQAAPAPPAAPAAPGAPAAAAAPPSKGTLTDTGIYEALQDLKKAKPYALAQSAKDIAALGPRLLPKLAEAISSPTAVEEEAYVTACMLTVRELDQREGPEVARQATDALIKASQSPSPRLRYVAASLLGDLWKLHGPDDKRPVAVMRNINAALMASAYRAAGSPGIYGPALAMIDINEIPNIERPADNSPEELAEFLRRWQAASPERLPALQEQPWILLLARVMENPASEEAKSAADLLQRERPLEAADFLVAQMAREQATPPRWQAMARLLTAITAVPMPEAPPAAQKAAVVNKWEQDWRNKLRQSKQPHFRAYTWLQLERDVTRMRVQPSLAAQAAIEQWSDVITDQFKSPDEIPKDASEAAVRLVQGPLKFKAQCEETLAALHNPETPSYKGPGLIKALQRGALASPKNQALAMRYLNEFTAYGRKEKHDLTLQALGEYLADITGLPLELTRLTDEERKNRLDQWSRIVRESMPKPAP